MYVIVVNDEVFRLIVKVDAVGPKCLAAPKFIVGDLGPLSIGAPSVDAPHVVGKQRPVGDLVEQYAAILQTVQKYARASGARNRVVQELVVAVSGCPVVHVEASMVRGLVHDIVDHVVLNQVSIARHNQAGGTALFDERILPSVVVSDDTVHITFRIVGIEAAKVRRILD